MKEFDWAIRIAVEATQIHNIMRSRKISYNDKEAIVREQLAKLITDVEIETTGRLTDSTIEPIQVSAREEEWTWEVLLGDKEDHTEIVGFSVLHPIWITKRRYGYDFYMPGSNHVIDEQEWTTEQVNEQLRKLGVRPDAEWED
jgi:hypothetical protein